MNIKNEYKHVHEEIWYISQNRAFQEKVKKIRSKYNLPKQRFPNVVVRWIESNWTPKQRNAFSEDVKRLLFRCKGAKGTSWFVFNPIITSYILTNVLQPAFYGLPHEIEDVIKIRRLDDKVEVTLLLGYDSTQKYINEILDVHWKTIEKMQETLAGKKIRKSADFELKKCFWNGTKNQRRSAKDLVDDSKNDHKGYSQYDISKIVRSMDTRIVSSFK